MNIDNPRRRGQWRVLAFLFLLAIGLFVLDSQGALGNVVGFLRNPLSTLTAQTSGLTTLLRRPADLQTAYIEIQTLQARVDTLQRENDQLREISAEYQRLLELLNRQSETPNLQRITAEVIGRGPNPLFRDLLIDKGLDDGVRVGMPVESGRGLVGQIFRVTANTAQVILITSPESHVPARLSQSRATGVVSGAETGGLLNMDWLNLEAQVAINDIVFTSGLTGGTREEQIANRFPQDIVIGRVVEIERGASQLFQRVSVLPAVDFDALETLFVITDFEPIDTTLFENSTP